MKLNPTKIIRGKDGSFLHLTFIKKMCLWDLFFKDQIKTGKINSPEEVVELTKRFLERKGDDVELS